METAASIFKELCYNYRDALLASILVAGWDKKKGGEIILNVALTRHMKLDEKFDAWRNPVSRTGFCCSLATVLYMPTILKRSLCQKKQQIINHIYFTHVTKI